MVREAALARSPLLTGLGEDALSAVAERMRDRQIAAGETLCSAGEESDRIWVITSGLVNWIGSTEEGGGELELRLRKGDVIGAQDALTDQPRSATVVASIDSTAAELDAADLAELAQQFPQILLNVIGTLRKRLFRTSARTAGTVRGEELALALGPSLGGAAGRLVAAARTASTRPVTYLDKRLSFAGALTASDEAAGEHATVLIPADLEPETVAVLLGEVDRVVAVVGSGEEAELLGRLGAGAQAGALEVVLVGEEARAAHEAWAPELKACVERSCARGEDYPLEDADLAWLARHVTRTKLGVALGAGGAKGYAHVGVLQVLEEAGYTIDNVGGSSIGGFVATHVALGFDAAEIDARFRRAFNPDAVSALFSSPFGGGSAGIEALTGLLKQATEERFFSHTVMPLVIMALDLTGRAPWPQRDGPLWEALMAALAVAGVFPVQERDGRRLVDAIALVPVPTSAVLEDGADLVVSVNLLGAETLERWPGQPEPEEAPAKKRRGMLDTMLEVMDLSQLDTSARHAALADMVVTPRFGPADWRDFHMADLFLEAGRTAALEQLPSLQALTRPVDLDLARREEGLATFA